MADEKALICYQQTMHIAKQWLGSGLITEGDYQKFDTIWGRIKRAVKILFGKPIYYNDLHLEGEERFHKLVGDMEELERLEYAGGEER